MVRLSKNQDLVLDVLVNKAVPMSAYEILDELRAEGIKAPLQVYRALEKLIDNGHVHRLESLSAFVACCSQDHLCSSSPGVTGFAICELCEQVEEFHTGNAEELASAYFDKSGFKPQRTMIEIRGVCAQCAKKTT